MWVFYFLCFSAASAARVNNVNGGYSFSNVGTIHGSIIYAPLVFDFNITKLELQAKFFMNEVMDFQNDNTSAAFLAHGKAWNFASEPYKELSLIKNMFKTKTHRVKRQLAVGASIAAVGMSAWALARTAELEGTVSRVEDRQAKIAHHVDALAARVEEHDSLFHAVNDSLALVQKSQQQFTVELGYYGYFSNTRSYTRSIEKFSRGIEQLLLHQLSPALVQPSLVSTSYSSLMKKAKKQGFVSVLNNWQQLYLHQADFVYQDGVLKVVCYVPLTSKDSRTFELFHFHSAPFLYNGSLLEFKPHHDFAVINAENKPVASLSTAFLHRCRRISAMHLCEEPIIESSTATGCLPSLFNQDFHEALDKCPLSYMPYSPFYVSLNRTTILLFSPNATHLQEKCHSDLEPKLFRVQNMVTIESEPSCAISCEGFRLVMGGDTPFHQESRVHIPLLNLTKPELKRIPLLRPLKPLDYASMHQDLQNIAREDEVEASFLKGDHSVLWVLLSVTVLVVIVVVFMLYRCVLKAKLKNLSTSIDAVEMKTKKVTVSDDQVKSLLGAQSKEFLLQCFSEDSDLQQEISRVIQKKVKKAIQDAIASEVT